MLKVFNFTVLGLLLVGAIGCGREEAATEIQAARSCGIEGLYARLDEATTLSIELEGIVADARPRIAGKWVADQRSPLQFAEDFDPIVEKRASVLPSPGVGRLQLSVLFRLDPNMAEQERRAVLATPGKMVLTLSYPVDGGETDSCALDVNLAPPL